MTACMTIEAPHQPIVEAAKPVIPCPSQDFSNFFQVYADSSDIQRQYVLLPLQHATVEAGAEKAVIK